MAWKFFCLEGYLVNLLGCHSKHPPDYLINLRNYFLLLLKLLISFKNLARIFNVGGKFLPTIIFSLFNGIFVLPSQGNVRMFTLGGLNFAKFP